jgi:hypothetical protein
MAHRRYRLTPGLVQQILSGIRAGGYAQVAAQAFGVPDAVFADWLRRGDAAGAREPYASFAAGVREAEAQARLRAENEVFSDKVQRWLEHGPGRERAGQPGWSAAVKGPSMAAEADGNLWLSPVFLGLVRGLLVELDSTPEVRTRLNKLVTDIECAAACPTTSTAASRRNAA